MAEVGWKVCRTVCWNWVALRSVLYHGNGPTCCVWGTLLCQKQEGLSTEYSSESCSDLTIYAHVILGIEPLELIQYMVIEPHHVKLSTTLE